MRMHIIPAIKLTEGRDFEGRWVLRDKIIGPVDFTEVIGGETWSATFRMAAKLSDDPLVSKAATLTSAGAIVVDMTASEFADLIVPPVIGGAQVGVFQIEITSPLPDLSQIWQGPVHLSGVI